MMMMESPKKRRNPILEKMNSLFEAGHLDSVELGNPKRKCWADEVNDVMKSNEFLESNPKRKCWADEVNDVMEAKHKSLSSSSTARPSSAVSYRTDLTEELEQFEFVQVSEEDRKKDPNRRWLGNQPEEIEEEFVRKRAQDLDPSGQPLDINLRFLYLNVIPEILSQGLGRDLVSLNIASNNIKSLKGITNMPRLLELKAYQCELISLEGIEAPRLIKLDVSDNHLDSSIFTILGKLRSLEVLNLEKNKLMELEGINILTKLKELHVSGNNIRKLGKSLYKLKLLETLYLDDNKLGPTIDGICFCDQLHLTELSIKKNLLREVSFLQVEKLPGEIGLVATKNAGRNIMNWFPTFPNLQYLYVQNNEIAKIDVVPCETLFEINLENNLIDMITDSFIAAFPKLEVCYLSANRMNCSDSWRKIIGFPNLKEVSLDDNPWLDGLSEASRKGLMLRELPHLEILDDLCVVEQAKVKEPLMHLAKTSTNHYRYFNEAALKQWETQQCKTLDAIDTQIQKKIEESSHELKRMDTYLENADKVLKKEFELRSKDELNNSEALSHVSDGPAYGFDACNQLNPIPLTKKNHLRRKWDLAKTCEPIMEEEKSNISPVSSPIRETTLPYFNLETKEFSDDEIDPDMPSLMPLEELAQALIDNDGDGDDEREEKWELFSSGDEEDREELMVPEPVPMQKIPEPLSAIDELLMNGSLPEDTIIADEESTDQDDNEAESVNTRKDSVTPSEECTTVSGLQSSTSDNRPNSGTASRSSLGSMATTTTTVGISRLSAEQRKELVADYSRRTAEQRKRLLGESESRPGVTPDLHPFPLLTEARAERRRSSAGNSQSDFFTRTNSKESLGRSSSKELIRRSNSKLSISDNKSTIICNELSNESVPDDKSKISDNILKDGIRSQSKESTTVPDDESIRNISKRTIDSEDQSPSNSPEIDNEKNDQFISHKGSLDNEEQENDIILETARTEVSSTNKNMKGNDILETARTQAEGELEYEVDTEDSHMISTVIHDNESEYPLTSARPVDVVGDINGGNELEHVLTSARSNNGMCESDSGANLCSSDVAHSKDGAGATDIVTNLCPTDSMEASMSDHQKVRSMTQSSVTAVKKDDAKKSITKTSSVVKPPIPSKKASTVTARPPPKRKASTTDKGPMERKSSLPRKESTKAGAPSPRKVDPSPQRKEGSKVVAKKKVAKAL